LSQLSPFFLCTNPPRRSHRLLPQTEPAVPSSLLLSPTTCQLSRILFFFFLARLPPRSRLPFSTLVFFSSLVRAFVCALLRSSHIQSSYQSVPSFFPVYLSGLGLSSHDCSFFLLMPPLIVMSSCFMCVSPPPAPPDFVGFFAHFTANVSTGHCRITLRPALLVILPHRRAA